MYKNLINISDLNETDINEILELSKKIENDNYKEDLNKKKIGLIFEKPSTRTRLSFISGIHELNGVPIEIDLNNLNLSRNESLIDTFKMFDLYLDGLVFRTNKHEKLLTASKYFNKPIINALSDLSHPCQILADFFTLNEIFKKDKLIISWFGDVNNVLFSLIELSKLIPRIHLNIFTDKSLFSDVFKNLLSKNIQTKDKVCDKTVNMSDCIMTDVFTSMNDDYDNNKREKLLPFQVNKNIISQMNDNAVFMHCLPANIGEEVTSDVINSNKSIILKQAYNRKVLQKGLISWLKF